MSFETYDRRIKIELLTCLPLLILAIALPVSAWCGIGSLDEEVKIWFQRSGSITVLLAVWVEFKLFTINKHLSPMGESGVSWNDLKLRDELQVKYNTLVSRLKYVVATFGISGTVIWGYGDLLKIYFS